MDNHAYNDSSTPNNLIDLQPNTAEHLSEFDPFAPTVQKVTRKPSRPPPPPPNVPPRRTNTISDPLSQSTLTTDLVNLDLDPKTEQKLVNVSKDDPTVNIMHLDNSGQKYPELPRPKSSSFVSYISSTAPKPTEIVTNQNNINSTDSRAGMHDVGRSAFSNFEGATGKNEVTSHLLEREKLMPLYMAKRQDDYTSTAPFNVFVGTWNVNGQLPTEPLDAWVSSEVTPPDVYAIGFQELDLSKEAFVFTESSREEEWMKAVKQALHPGASYKLVKHIRLVGMMLLVFAQDRHLEDITAVASHHVGTGLLGKMGNKGGVGVRIMLHNSSLCFINSHLAAHVEEIQRRNQDYQDICSRMKFPDPEGQSISVFSNDVLIWLGDLNYRIDKLPLETVKERIEKGQYEKLKEHDQLTSQRREGNVYPDFEEGDLTFRPTYKYNPGTDEWDTSEKCRCPAWCDRILWKESAKTKPRKTKRKDLVQLLKYQAHLSLKISDHKPVSAVFKINVKVITRELYRKVYEEEIRRLDRMENEWLPTMVLNQHSLEFGTVKFQQAVQRTVEILNTGQTPCHFEFIGKLGEKAFCKPWLTVGKPKGYVLPGDKLVIEFEVYVNKNTAPSLNKEEDKIEDILILHLVGGKDFFITVNGKYSPSCFGTSIEALCWMKKPIEQMDRKELTRLSCTESRDWQVNNEKHHSSQMLNVPKELWRLLDHLYQYARHQPDLFQKPGLHEELKMIQENLDSQLPTVGTPLPGSNHSVAEALLVFLEALPEPVIPFEFYPMCLQIYNNYDQGQELIHKMPPHHVNVFNYIISFLQELPKYEENGLNLHLLATIFSGLLLRPSSVQRKQNTEGRMDRMKATTFIEMFLKNKLLE
ncbi:inositol polyphosphate 5-phosphatase OCRL isoform X2 [Ciona intestinalis]